MFIAALYTIDKTWEVPTDGWIDKQVISKKIKKQNQIHKKKRDKICCYQRWEWEEGDLEKGGQVIKTSSYKTNNY